MSYLDPAGFNWQPFHYFLYLTSTLALPLKKNVEVLSAG